MTRRRLAAVLLSVAVLTALLVAVAGPRARRWAEDRLRRTVETRAAALLGGPVKIERLQVRLFPARVVAEIVEGSRTGNRGSQLVSAADEVTVHVPLKALLGRIEGPFAVMVRRPRLTLHLAEGRALFQRDDTAPEEPGSVAVPPGSSLEVADGSVQFDIAGGPSIRMEGVRLKAVPRPDGGAAGRLEFSGGEYDGPGGVWRGLGGTVDFATQGHDLHLDPVALRSEGLNVSGRVQMTGGDAPGLDGAIDVALDVGQLAKSFPEGSSPSGQLKASLSGRVRDGVPEANGTLEVENFTLWGLSIGTLRSDLLIDKGVHLRGLRAHVLGGEATGTADVTFAQERFQTDAELRLDGVDAAQVLQYAGWTGPAVTGTIHYSGRHHIDSTGLASLRGRGTVDAVGAYRSPQGEDLPLEVTVDLLTEGEVIRLANGSLRAGSTRASFTGRVARGEGIALKMSGGTGNLQEILPLFAAPRKKPAPRSPPVQRGSWQPFPAVVPASWPPRPVPFRWSRRARPGRARGAAAARPARPARAPAEATPLERIVQALGGRWQWNGDLSYGPHGLEFTGDLSGADLTFESTPLGSLRARIGYRDDTLRIEEAVLRADALSSARVSGRVDFRGAGALSLEGTAEHYPLAPVLAIAGFRAPLAGRLTGRVALAGTPTAPTGRAAIEIAPVSVAGVPFDVLSGELIFTPDLLEMKPLTLALGGGVLTAEGTIPYRAGTWIAPAGGSTPRLTLKGDGFDLAALPLKGGRAVSGIVRVDGTVEGALMEPRGSVDLAITGLGLQGYDLGDVTARADLTGGSAEVRVDAPRRRLSMTGHLGLEDGRPFSVRAVVPEIRLRSADFGEGTPEEIELVLGFEASLDGRLDDVSTIAGRALASQLTASVGGVEMTAEGPVEAILEPGGTMRLHPLVLSGPGTRLELSGALDPGAAGRVDLSASGRFDLKFLRLFLKNLQATGEGSVVLSVRGPLAAPEYAGRVVIDAGAVRHPDLPFPIDDVLGKATFDNSILRIDRLEFLAGGGPVEGSGEIHVGDPGRRESPLAISGARVRFRGRDVKGEFPQGFRSVSDLDLVFARDAGTASLTGRVDLVRGQYVRDFKLDAPIGVSRAGEVFRTPAPGVFAGLGLDIVVHADQDVWLRNDFGKIEGEGELRVRGTADRPSFAGRIAAREGGTIRFRNVEYRVQGGSIDFADPDVINPIFDLQADTRVGEYDVTLHAEGTLDDFEYHLESTPPLPEPDIVALLLTGRTLGALGPETGGLAEETIGSYLSGLTGELTGHVAGRAGFDVISIDPLQVSAQGDPTTRITLGKQVTPDLFVAYASDVGSTTGAIYQLDYRVAPDFHFTSVRDSDGSIGGDFRFVLRGRLPGIPGIVDPTADQPLIHAVSIEGEPRYKDTQVLRKLRLKPGRRRVRSAVSDGIDRLLDFYHRRDFLMADVDVHESPGPDGKVDLTFHVQAGPRVRLSIEGARGRPGLRQEIAPYWEKGLFAEEILEQARARLEEIYRDRGYLRIEVAPEVQRNDAQEMRVRFTVRRGPRARVAEVRLDGVQRVPETDIRKAIRTRPAGTFRRAVVSRPKLEADAEAVRGIYLARGFPLASVPEPHVGLDDAGERAVVAFTVLEGPRVTFGPPRFEGGRTYPAEILAKTAHLPVGEPYTEAGLDAAALRVRRRYDDDGFPDAKVAWRPIQIKAGSGDVVESPVLEIREGQHQRVGRVTVTGNVLTRDPVIRKAVTVEPHTSLSRREMQASETRLYGRGLFRSVAIDPVPPAAAGAAAGTASDGAAAAPGTAPSPPQASPPPAGETGAPAAGAGDGAAGPAAPAGIVERDVRVTVRESPPVTQVYGIGYASDEGLRGLYEISNRNVFGNGRYIGLQTRASRLEQRGTLSFREKGVFGGSYDVLASIFGEDEVRPAFDVHTFGSAVQIERRFTRATRVLYGYTLKDVNLSDPTASFEESTVRLSSLASSAAHDTRDAPFDPTRGHYLGGEVRWYGAPIGSEADFVKLFAQLYKFKKVFPGTVWAQAVRAGVTIPYGASSAGGPLSCAEGNIVDSGVPPSERFFAGGDTTLRGFSRDRLGETCNGDPLGGEGVFILNEEIRFPLYRSIGGVLFYDGGNVYRTLDQFQLSHLRHVIGAGLRLSTPIGPLRLEYGRIVDREPGEEPGQLFFSIGQAF